MTDTAPILLFTFKRVESLKETIKALQNNFLAQQSDLFIFSDGPRNHNDEELVNQVRLIIRNISGFNKITIFESIENKGLAPSIIEGVSQIITISGKVIVLEDDLITTPNFLNFMNAALNHYTVNKEVFSVAGYSFDLKMDVRDAGTDAYLINRGWPWGWATWDDRWKKVDWTMEDYPDFKQNRKLRSEFALGGSDLNAMLDKQMKGMLDSWAIRWFYNQYKVKGLTLYPKYSKVYNNGFDQYATHTKGSFTRYIPKLDATMEKQFKFPESISIHAHYQKKFLKKMGIISRIISKIETVFLASQKPNK